MKSQIHLGRAFGVPIGLHYTWLILAALITVAIGGYFAASHPSWSAGVVWTAAIVTGTLFFVTLVLHELSHALVARANGLPVSSITLFALGGVAQIEEDATNPKVEFAMGIVGPLTSIVIGLVCLGLAAAGGWSPGRTAGGPVTAVAVWLGYINLVLAGFNLIPGYPLDGGRVLRSIVWKITGSVDRATRAAARVGQMVAMLFIGFGLLRFFHAGTFDGVWLALIGWFLLSAASASYQQVDLSARLRDVRVRDVMQPECDTVDAGVRLQAFVDDHVLRSGRRCFIVERGGEVAGLVTVTDIRHVERARWPETRVGDIMRRIDEVQTVSPDLPLMQALKTMARLDVNQLPVMRDGHLEGMITRSHIVNYVHARTELQG